MKPFLLLPALLIVLPTQAQGDARGKAETLVSEAAQFARESGADKLIQEINHAQGRFGNRDAMKPQLIVYDLKGKILAHSRDVRHVGMDHSRAVSRLLEVAKSRKKGWFEPPSGAGDLETTTYFERVGDILITAPPHFH